MCYEWSEARVVERLRRDGIKHGSPLFSNIVLLPGKLLYTINRLQHLVWLILGVLMSQFMSCQSSKHPSIQFHVSSIYPSHPFVSLIKFTFIRYLIFTSRELHPVYMMKKRRIPNVAYLVSTFDYLIFLARTYSSMMDSVKKKLQAYLQPVRTTMLLLFIQCLCCCDRCHRVQLFITIMIVVNLDDRQGKFRRWYFASWEIQLHCLLDRIEAQAESMGQQQCQGGRRYLRANPCSQA